MASVEQRSWSCPGGGNTPCSRDGRALAIRNFTRFYGYDRIYCHAAIYYCFAARGPPHCIVDAPIRAFPSVSPISCDVCLASEQAVLCGLGGAAGHAGPAGPV